MSIYFGIAIYFVCWWITWMVVLPLGVRPQGEEGEIVPGTMPSAPAKPYIGRKLILASILALLPLAFIIGVMEYDILSFDDFPFVPEFSNG
jgi:predicted secreted protein